MGRNIWRKSQIEPGEWVQPNRRGYKLACCDCRLVHKLDFRLIATNRGRFIQFRAFRDERATAAMRRKRKPMGKPGTTRVYRSRDGYRWRAYARNGNLVAECRQGYSKRSHAVRMAGKYGPAGFVVATEG